jgi:DNA-binding NtrC family response regulator
MPKEQLSPEKSLIVDDNPVNIRVLTETLEPHGYEISAASNADQTLKLAARILPDLILLDVIMPGRDGFAVCQALKANELTREIPVLFVTAKLETEAILRGFKAGAVDYIAKPFQAEEIVARAKTHLKLSRLTREIKERNRQLETEIERRRVAENDRQTACERLSSLSAHEAKRWGLASFVGESPLIRTILADVKRLHLFSNTNVLVTGESGTGKELVARAIHHGSARAEAPFVPVNCVAIPTELAESAFFGHLRGSFTGATSDRKGYFELADGGTLFLDEIGDMPLNLQAKLLRVLEDGEITPVGAPKSKRVDVRIVAATNADLSGKIALGEFRQDLFFRLARYTVETPPLRQHPKDIPLLANHFLTLFATEMGLTPPAWTPEAVALLESYFFPGNVRELKNIIERALIESAGKPIQPAHIRLQPLTGRGGPLSSPAQASSSTLAPLPFNLEAAEQELIQRAIQETQGNIAEAARLLGVNRSRIYRRMPLK